MEKLRGSDITHKGKVGQFFCRHKNTDWYVKRAPFLNLSGDAHYKMCEDCGKQMEKTFVRHE